MEEQSCAPIIQLKNFTFTYEESSMPSLADINLEIGAGEVVLLTGQSGCGKTTLTRCINGLIPDFYPGSFEGDCTVCGMKLGEHETSDYAACVGSVFQDPRSQFFTLHVKTEIPFPGENLAAPRGIVQKRSIDAVDSFQIKKLFDKSIFDLSSGEKQKVAIASAYTAGVHIFVLDEPSANLDDVGTMQLLDVLKRLKAQGNTILISEHKIYYMQKLVDRVIFMENGRIADDMPGSSFVQMPVKWFTQHKMRQIELSSITPNCPHMEPHQNDVNLEVQQLSFYYQRNKPLWEHANFSVSGGDIVGVIGKNGVGKSTLIRVLMGLEKPKSGKILIHHTVTTKKRRRECSFYVMQDVDYQLFAPSLMEEMLLGTENTPEDTKKASELLAYFGLSDYQDCHPSQLSGGQKQRLSIAMAYMSTADFFFMDEPTSGLDGDNMHLVSSAICDLARRGHCVFVITHDYEFAAQTFRSLLLIKENGEIYRIEPTQYTPDTLYQNFQSNKGV